MTNYRIFQNIFVWLKNITNFAIAFTNKTHHMLKKKTKRMAHFVMISTALVAASCVDGNYDLNKEIDMTVSIGGSGITLPIGYTDSVKLNSIIDTANSETLILGDNDIYSIQQKDEIETVDIDVTSPTIKDIAPEFQGVVAKFELPDYQTRASGNPGELLAYVNDVSDFDINEEIDQAIKSLKVILWKEPIEMTYTMTFDQFPGEVIQNGVNLDHLQVQLPEFITFAPEEGIEHGLLKLSGNYDPNSDKPFTKTLKVIGMDFTQLPGNNGTGLTIKDQRLIIDRTDAGIEVSGYITAAPDNDASPDDLHEFTIYPSLHIPVMSVGKIVGQFDPEIDEVNELVELNLDDDMDFLQDDDVYLDIDNPIIKIALTNTVDVPVDMQLSMHGEEENGTIVGGSEVLIDLSGTNCLAPAENSSPVTTVYYISRKEVALPVAREEQTVYRNVVVNDLSSLIRRIPDNVRLDITAKVNQSEEHAVDLTQDLYISGSYDVTVPLSFDGLNINYGDTIKNLQDDISDFLDQTKEMELSVQGKLYNGIPLSMQLHARALDRSGNELNTDRVTLDVYVNGEKDGLIAAPATDGSSAVSDIEIQIKSSGDDLRQLDMIEWNISVTKNEDEGNTPESVALKGEQYILFKELQATLKKLTLDLN